MTISGEPAVLMQEYFWENGQQLSYNQLEIFLDEEQIRLRSGLAESELLKH